MCCAVSVRHCPVKYRLGGVELCYVLVLYREVVVDDGAAG